MTKLQAQNTIESLSTVLTNAKELFNEMVRLADELNAAKERVAELEEENKKLRAELMLAKNLGESVSMSYKGVLHNLQLIYRRELPGAIAKVAETLKEYSRETKSVLRKGKTSKLADEILIYSRDNDEKWIKEGLLEANVFAAQDRMTNETEREYEIRCQLLKDTNQADVMIGYLKRKTVKGPDGDIIEVPTCIN